MDRADAVEPTETDWHHSNVTGHFSFFPAKVCASTHNLTPSLYGVCVEAGQGVQRAAIGRCSGLRWSGSSCSFGDRRGCQRATEAPGNS